MTWQKARKLIKARILVGTDVNTSRSHYRVIRSRDDKLGFVVPIGQDNSISIPWEMLQICYVQIQNGTDYDGTFFRAQFPKEACNHPCYVHV